MSRCSVFQVLKGICGKEVSHLIYSLPCEKKWLILVNIMYHYVVQLILLKGDYSMKTFHILCLMLVAGAVYVLGAESMPNKTKTLSGENTMNEKELADLTIAIIAINGWNRLNIAFKTPVVCDIK